MVRTVIRLGALLGVLVVALGLWVACGGVSQKDLDAANAQVAAKEQEVAKLRQDLQAAQAAGQGTAALQQQLDAKNKEIEDLKKSAANLQGITPLVYTKEQPTPTPRPTATPRPPGFVAPTPVPPDDVTVNTVFPYTFYVETLTGHQVSGFAQYPSCVPNTQFRRGAHIVWRFEVFDTSTGKRLTSLDSPTVKLVLENGQEVPARFARKAGTGPWTWVAAWDPPMDYPLGPLDYTIQVQSKDGSRKGAFDPKLVDLTNPPPGIDQRVQILE
ncbi:MAG: hypothetical protein HY683_00905 [Chloroflexi bacterium]|nr:hypothetical protein [Chloroflexota bacterium]